ncbi:MAG TPA: hypothetical protein VMQ86_25585 [Bryobacteraceae bacterium]|jgi:hypothetical protein|nr:hypothetical protein [Bryobacteraceae bacterium]
MGNLTYCQSKATLQRASKDQLAVLAELACEQLGRAVSLAELIANEYIRRARRRPPPRHGRTVQ